MCPRKGEDVNSEAWLARQRRWRWLGLRGSAYRARGFAEVLVNGINGNSLTTPEQAQAANALLQASRDLVDTFDSSELMNAQRERRREALK